MSKNNKNLEYITSDNKKSNFIYNDLLPYSYKEKKEYWEQNSIFATMPRIEFIKKFMNINNLEIVSSDYLFKNLSNLVRTFYRSIDKDFDTKSEFDFDEEIKKNERELNKIYIDDIENKISYKNSDSSKWFDTSNIDINIENLTRMYRGISDEGLVNGEYILFDDLKESLINFYNNNKKKNYKVEKDKGKIVKYHLDKRQIDKYLKIVKESHKIIISEKNKIKELSLKPSRTKEYKLQKVNLGNLDIKDGQYINVNVAIANMGMLFKKTIINFDNIKKKSNLDKLEKPVIHLEPLSVDDLIVENPNNMDKIINLFNINENRESLYQRDELKKQELEEIINNCLNDFSQETAQFKNDISKSK